MKAGDLVRLPGAKGEDWGVGTVQAVAKPHVDVLWVFRGRRSHLVSELAIVPGDKD